jgi:Uma2 family endonuclease
MGVPIINTGPMSVDDFHAFTASRPDDERWELIEGKPVMNATASSLHQIIVKNLLVCLDRVESETNASWQSMPGISVRVSRTSAPVPDVLVRPGDQARLIECGDMIVAFEVLSPTTEDLDLEWKRTAYASMASLQHYVVVAQDAVEIVCFDRATGFAERRVGRSDARLDLPAIDASLALADIYRRTGLL